MSSPDTQDEKAKRRRKNCAFFFIIQRNKGLETAAKGKRGMKTDLHTDALRAACVGRMRFHSPGMRKVRRNGFAPQRAAVWQVRGASRVVLFRGYLDVLLLRGGICRLYLSAFSFSA